MAQPEILRIAPRDIRSMTADTLETVVARDALSCSGALGAAFLGGFPAVDQLVDAVFEVIHGSFPLAVRNLNQPK
jgi:hypothetical protein